MKPAYDGSAPLAPEERLKRKRYLAATLITCMAIAMVGGALHVVQLGANRMSDMRDRATYDLAEEHTRIRAAGEDIALHTRHEQGDVTAQFTLEEVQALLTPEQWREIETTIVIPAGPFTAGTDRVNTDPQNRPAHTVDLPAYRIDKYPVTVAQYARFVASTGHAPPLDWKDGQIPRDKLLHPVTLISWRDAVDYAEWAGKRLPTEMEWEKAARGADARRWPWGNQMEPTRLNTYYGIGSTTPVDAYAEGASPYGVMDLAGNVFEWTADVFVPYPGSDAPAELFRIKVPVVTSEVDRRQGVSDLMVTDKLGYRVLRGGSWKSDPFSTSAFHRNYALPDYASDFYGFRCALDASEGRK